MTGERSVGEAWSISPGEVSELYASGRFDADFYTKSYPDVRQSGLDPAAHFLWLGARLGRLGQAPRSFPDKSDPGILDVLFVDGTNGTSSTPYRVDRVATGLRGLGASVRCIRGDELAKVDREHLRARHVTFFRTPFWEPYRSFARAMRASGARIVFDVDDLVFDEDEIPLVDGYRYLTGDEKIGYRRGVRAYRDFVLFADFCTAPTEFLAKRLRTLGKKSYRIRNTIDEIEITRFTGRAASAPSRSEPFVVGYYSGSKTHQADFRNAGEALIRFMGAHDSVKFRLVGEFDLSEYPRLRQWDTNDAGARVTSVGLLPHSRMLEDQLNCDLIIAPLEVGNPFCEAKSELKFFEAALARRPVIASPTETFRIATRDGELAQLADSSEQWLTAFENAHSNRERWAVIAARAHDFVIEQYGPAAAGQDAMKAYDEQKDVAGSSSAMAKSDSTG